MKDNEKLYEQHKNLIHSEVWRACRKFPFLAEDDISSIANEVFTKCCKKYKASKRVKFSTYLTCALRNAFKAYPWYGTEPVVDSVGSEVEQLASVNGMCGAERLVGLKQALEGMSSLAMEVANLVFCPTEALQALMEKRQKPIPTKGVLREYLRKTLGIGDANAISDAFAEIAQTLEEV